MTKKILFGMLLLSVVTPIWAHKINVFVDVEGNQASVAGYFMDGKTPQQTPVTVFDGAGALLLEGKTDDAGEFVFTLPQGKKGIKVKIDAGMGHVAEYVIPDEDLQEGEAVASALSASATSSDVAATDVSAHSSANMPLSLDQKNLSKMIEKAVAKANRPLRRSLDEMRKKASLSDIIGGLGFIFGGLGLWFFLQARKLQATVKEVR